MHRELKINSENIVDIISNVIIPLKINIKDYKKGTFKIFF
jgi:hypothetical protein